MSDETELLRKMRQMELNKTGRETEQGRRTRLEKEYGQVWNTEEMCRDFETLGFMSPYVVVTRKSDGKKGSLEFTHFPRFFFNFQVHEGD